MGGVDLAYQRISYSSPDLRCKRNWMPTMLGCINIVRNNVLLLYRNHSNVAMGDDDLKLVTLEIVASLRSAARRSFSNQICSTRSTSIPEGGGNDLNGNNGTRRIRISKNNPCLPSKRLDRPIQLHRFVIS